MDLIGAIEIFATLTGVAYVVLEILQKNAMWVVGILTGAACAYSFAVQHLWASMGLNIYYVGMSVWGIIQWKKDSAASGGALHLGTLTRGVILWSAVLTLAGCALLTWILGLAMDSFPLHDAAVTMLSVTATVWLVRSYPAQWLLWIAVDSLSAWLCLRSGMPWMGVLYIVYAASAVYGWIHWKKHGIYV